MGAPNSGAMTNALPHPRTIAGAVVAGITAGITIVACFAGLNGAVLRQPDFTLQRFFAFAASTLVGNIAYTSSKYVALGVLLHFLVAVGWSVGYAIAAEHQPQLITRPIISGAAFGFIVYFAMQLVIVGANLYHIPTPSELGVALVAHMVFYGIPVALIVARLRRAK